jgi:holo-[acyl-carrier protein] synthase
MMERWDRRFLSRVFTPVVLSFCLTRRRPEQHLAARFAAKEAALKALGTGLSMGVRWREIEVRRGQGEPPTIHFSGRTDDLSRERGATQGLVSLTHDGEYAMAQVLLVGEE